MHHQTRLLLLALDRHEAHVGALHGFADRLRIGGVVLALLAAQPVRRNELGRHQLDRVTLPVELASPVVRARARLHRNDAGRQRSDQRAQFVARHLGLAQLHTPSLIDTVHREYVLGQIDSSVQNTHDFPFPLS